MSIGKYILIVFIIHEANRFTCFRLLFIFITRIATCIGIFSSYPIRINISVFSSDYAIISNVFFFPSSIIILEAPSNWAIFIFLTIFTNYLKGEKKYELECLIKNKWVFKSQKSTFSLASLLECKTSQRISLKFNEKNVKAENQRSYYIIRYILLDIRRGRPPLHPTKCRTHGLNLHCGQLAKFFRHVHMYKCIICSAKNLYSSVKSFRDSMKFSLKMIKSKCF